MANPLSPEELRSLENLLRIAKTDTGQAGCVANFLLAWWNALECGGFDLTDLWGLDTEIRADILRLVAYIAANSAWPTDLMERDFRGDFHAIIDRWRPASNDDQLDLKRATARALQALPMSEPLGKITINARDVQRERLVWIAETPSRTYVLTSNRQLFRTEVISSRRK